MVLGPVFDLGNLVRNAWGVKASKRNPMCVCVCVKPGVGGELTQNYGGQRKASWSLFQSVVTLRRKSISHPPCCPDTFAIKRGGERDRHK